MEFRTQNEFWEAVLELLYQKSAPLRVRTEPSGVLEPRGGVQILQVGVVHQPSRHQKYLKAHFPTQKSDFGTQILHGKLRFAPQAAG